ncbi:hypothetical protein OG594_29460 [Streptomyces sp. NBC_01214]|uniref:hypothetical protein n=2 Tax=unclassified Streptomyces TaxID=2593676 RepID=UPI00225764CA|nr:hypothetical protein [Streptomyces sp. NBC_01214]MCX4805697.1 hypothetical protein [Streptomyces sp. NBC_01214]
MRDHPDGACARAHVRCSGCGLPAPVVTLYGGPMADCRHCHYAWGVHHDPVICWRRTATDEGLIARIREAAPLLVAARALLDEITRRP